MESPNPGSPEAIKQGCKCPILDNGRGRGWLGGVLDDAGQTIFAINGDCPLHGEAAVPHPSIN